MIFVFPGITISAMFSVQIEASRDACCISIKLGRIGPALSGDTTLLNIYFEYFFHFFVVRFCLFDSMTLD